VGLAELLLRRHAAVRHRRCLAFLSLSFRFSLRFLSLRRREESRVWASYMVPSLGSSCRLFAVSKSLTPRWAGPTSAST
jgi:hypothetical protein